MAKERYLSRVDKGGRSLCSDPLLATLLWALTGETALEEEGKGEEKILQYAIGRITTIVASVPIWFPGNRLNLLLYCVCGCEAGAVFTFPSSPRALPAIEFGWMKQVSFKMWDDLSRSCLLRTKRQHLCIDADGAWWEVKWCTIPLDRVPLRRNIMTLPRKLQSFTRKEQQRRWRRTRGSIQKGCCGFLFTKCLQEHGRANDSEAMDQFPFAYTDLNLLKRSFVSSSNKTTNRNMLPHKSQAR